ncbi:MAG: ABC transporter ATP-binding protein [Rhodospirillales bacterium]|nr:ABC transporter ATP-binding protein [Rhodospirillales bacterium]
MSEDTAIAIHGVSKIYRVYARPQDRLLQAFRRRQCFQEFWALRDLDFQVRRGETVGIIGRNGSGKSTLLQVICGTLQPSFGTVTIHGRISALLELGSGFNPDFSGRENVFLNASIMGLSRDEIEAIYDRIVAFADIGDHLEQPVKTYSSGMMMRLAFAVAINVEPDILIVDEALAVGDEAFQRKCLARLDAIRNAGATVLFVSHSSRQVIEVCDRVMLLDQGEKLYDGEPRTGVNLYHKMLYMPADKVPAFRETLKTRQDGEAAPVGESAAVATEGAAPAPVPAPASATITATAPQPSADSGEDWYNPGMVPQSTVSYESRGAHIEDVRITTLEDRQVNMLLPGRRYRMRFQVRLDQDVFMLAAGTRFKTITGVELGGGSTIYTDRMIDHVPAGSLLNVRHEFTCRLIEGTYFVNVGVSGVVSSERHWLHRIVDVAMFTILPDGQTRFSNGPVDFDLDSRVSFA